MDDRDFELHLRARLHRRFDTLQPSAELRAGVDQVLATPPQRAGLALLRGRRRELGWGALVAAGLIVALALTNGRLGGPFGPGAPSTPPQSPNAVSAGRNFIVLPPAGYDPDKADNTLAAQVLIERLRALLFSGPNQAFSSGGGYAITFALPKDGPSDDSIRAVLRTPGGLAFVPLPATYADGTHTAVIGQNLPTDEPALFGSEAIASASVSVDLQGRPMLSISLRPSAAEAFDVYTQSHVGSIFAIIVDDDVALLPTVNEPISDGRIQIAGAGPPGSEEATAFLETAAIIVGGTLPDAWIVPSVPELMSPSQIEAEMEFEFAHDPLSRATDVTVTSADLDAMLIGQRWTAIWRITVDGLAAACPSPLPSDERGTCRWTDPTLTHLFDAETGEWLGPATD
jgi:hypothetical protein